jgi:hypothetical protein
VRRSPSPGPTNPFRYGDVATGSFFTDREDELRELEIDVRSGQNVLVLSPRRFGKTSLVVEAMRLLREQGILIAYVDLLRATTKADLASFLATALYQGLVSPVEQTLHRVVEFFRDLPIKPSITLTPSPDGMVTPSIEFGASMPERAAEATLDQLLNLPAEIAAKRKRRVALILDEFQSILELDESLPRRLRATFQFQSEVAHVYLGSKQHLLRRVFTDANAPLYNSAKVLPLGAIATDRFAQFIKDRFADTKREIAPAAVVYLLGVTGGHPHDTQKLANFVWNLASASGRVIETADVDLALRQVLTTDTARYTELWESLTPNQRRVLQSVAHHGATEDIRSQRFREAHGLASYRSVDYALDSLVERSLIERLDTQRLSVPDVFLARWLREGGHWSTWPP